MTILKTICIYLLVSVFIPKITSETGQTDEADAGHRDTETELLDKEYGVRYADACEG